jgi:hypothetical protein
VLSFFKGALLNDANGILKKPGENTQAARLIPFTKVREIVVMEPILKAYIYEAIEVEKAGLKVNSKKTILRRTTAQSRMSLKSGPPAGFTCGGCTIRTTPFGAGECSSPRGSSIT